MNLTEEQELAIRVVKQKLMIGQPIVTIAGYAGTGKTTLIKYIIDDLRIEMRQVAFATFTGKAAFVLQQKGIPAMTLHALFFNSYRLKNNNFIHKKKKYLDLPYKLIVIDEISMVSLDMLQTAVSFKIPIIALGDIGQLPPIGYDNGLLAKPDVILTEIMRQEKDSPIIELSFNIRKGLPLQEQENEHVVVVKKENINTNYLLEADQVLCGYNETRMYLNEKLRTGYELPELFPSPGDKVICLRNNWEKFSDINKLPLVNGSIGYLARIDKKISDTEIQATFALDYVQDGYHKLNMTFDSKNKDKKFNEFDLAYAVTVHKSQGSQWNSVFVFEEVVNSKHHAKWLYTAVTRAINKIIIVKGDY